MLNFIDEMKNRFDSVAAQGVEAVYIFKIGDSKNYCVQIKNSEFQILEEIPDRGDITLSVDEKTWNDILTGKTPAQMAFMMGKLKVTGDISLALKLANIFKLSS